MMMNKVCSLTLAALGTISIGSQLFLAQGGEGVKGVRLASGGNEGTHGIAAISRANAFAESSTARFLRVSGGDATAEAGETIYKAKCSACHQAGRQGMPPTFPSLIDVSKRKTDDEIKAQIKNGKGIMPPFADLSDDDLNSLVLFLKTPPPPPADKPAGISAAPELI